MKIHQCIILISSFIFGSMHLFSRPSDEIELLFQNSNTAMIEKDYLRAIESYAECLEMRESANLHHNMGIARYLNGETGLAVLHLEKVSRMSLMKASTQEVLSLIRRSEGLSKPRYTVVQQLTRSLPEWFWLGSLVLGFWGMLFFGVYLFLLVNRISVYRDLAILSAIVFFLGITACVGLYEGSRLGVFLADENALKVIPTQKSESFMMIKGGETAKIIRENNGFVFVETTSRVRGWVTAENFKLVR